MIIMKKIYEKYSGLIFRIVLTVIVLVVWNNLSKVKTICYLPLYSYQYDDADIACKTVRDQEAMWRSVFSDTFPIIIFVGLIFILLWFRKK
tara:strand:- start:27 stop:299 length:273 start_codon:yes stop_codon:yes gene_type:complete